MNDGRRHARARIATEQSPNRRRADVDFWRGVVLCCILINHIPGNLFEGLTPKNYGFSDSSEAFVFLSGLSLGFAYSARFADGRAGQVMHALQRRVVKLYGLHLFLSLAAIAIYATGASLGHDADLMGVHGRELFVEDPGAALLGLASLGHQLGYFNILPLYIVLIAMLVVQLLIARLFGPWPMLVGAAIAYGVVRLFDLAIPTWPMRGTWFFNPLAWQLLMAIGLACATFSRDRAIPVRPWPLVLAGCVALIGLAAVTDGLSLTPGLGDWARRWGDLDKTSLGLGRLVHFLAVAYLLYGLRAAARLRRTSFYEGFGLMGRNSLTVFAVLSLLAAVGQVLTQLFGHALALDVVLVGGGIAILYGTAWLGETWHPVADMRTRLRAGGR